MQPLKILNGTVWAFTERLKTPTSTPNSTKPSWCGIIFNRHLLHGAGTTKTRAGEKYNMFPGLCKRKRIGLNTTSIVLDPDPHYLGNLDPHSNQIKILIRIRII
jgi:hypothetical protein